MNQNLKLRIMTALIGVPVILMLLLGLGVDGVAFFAWVISTGMLLEFSKMFLTGSDARKKTVTLVVFNTVIHAVNDWFGIGLNPAFLGIAPVFIFFVLFLLWIPRRGQPSEESLSQHFRELMAVSFGFVYCGWFPLLMVGIREMPLGKHWLVLTLVIVWASDTFAYFAGRTFGKHLLYPSVSPKKTWEGFAGGALGAIVLAVLYAHFFLPIQSVVEIAAIALTVSLVAALGDLCESLMKRASNVKDSGSILPGHGGFLDRFDGVVFALPVMSLILWLIF